MLSIYCYQSLYTECMCMYLRSWNTLTLMCVHFSCQAQMWSDSYCVWHINTLKANPDLLFTWQPVSETNTHTARVSSPQSVMEASITHILVTITHWSTYWTWQLFGRWWWAMVEPRHRGKHLCLSFTSQQFLGKGVAHIVGAQSLAPL